MPRAKKGRFNQSDRNASDEKTAEDSLWQAMKAGDGRAFSELMEQHYRPLYSYGTKLTFDKELVRDCIQEVFLEIWRRRAEIGVAESPRFYLLRSLQRKIYRENMLNRLFYNATELDPNDGFYVEFSIETELVVRQEHEQNARRLTELINTLSPRQKEVIYLRFYQNLSYDEIADFMQVNRQSVYNLLSDAIHRLRASWQGALLFLLIFLKN